MLFCNKNNIKIESDKTPDVNARVILPEMSDVEKADIRKKPFINNVDVTFTIVFDGVEYRIFIPKNYTWDGATIPFGFRWILGGKGNPAFLVASCVHDKLCECKWLVNNNRALSSLIFKELLLACGCGELKAKIMYFAVDNFQKLCGWEK